MKSEDIGAKTMYCLYCKQWGRPLEHRHSAAVLAWRVYRDNDVAGQPKGVDSIQ